MAAPAFAWGKTAQRIIAWTAVKSLPADQASMLSEYQTQLLDGATAPNNIVSRYFERDSIVATTHTIAQDMSLLRTVAQEGIDPYVAYRFGILAQVIADLNQPFTVVGDSTDKNPAKTAMLREQYERDTEQALETLNFGYRPRRPVYDVEAYFTEVRRYIQNSEYFLTQDYQNGAGFSEYGHRSLKLYYDNAVNSVADVWYTILGDTRLSPFIPPRSVAIERFRIEGIRYFLQIGQDDRAAQVVADLNSKGTLSTDAERRIADAYYDTGRHARAISGYERVLRRQPNWSDVRTRLSDYYNTLGQAYMKGGMLEEAQRAFQRVLTYDPQSQQARDELDKTINLVAAREQRLAQVRKRMSEASQLEDIAAKASESRKYATAINTLRKADEIYASVPVEFRAEYSMAYRARTAIQEKIARYSSTIIQEAMALDGVAEKSLLGKSMQQAAKEHAAKVIDMLTSQSHSARTQEMQQKVIERQRASI
ncbi:MAG: tetratricopeptide repeat protein [Candidatus Hydrogenedentes bacterium]|nr:tetratricopeptide repeat protein [Candidatus Hydrogenedentota bacterium]